jgi:hypothetical protein
MTFSDLEVVLSQASRGHGYVRDNIPRIWTPGGGPEQKGYSRELAGALLKEADCFFDRALMLYLLRSSLKDLQASTWAGVASYYSNYFAALSFIRLNFCSVTHVGGGGVFEVAISSGPDPYFSIRERRRRLGHSDIWDRYYSAVREMGWPDATSVATLAPIVKSLQFRVQLYRERINYRPGDGFEEIYLGPSRYQAHLKSTFHDPGLGYALLADAAHAEAMARERLSHVASLLRRLFESRLDKAAEEQIWQARRALVERYGTTRSDRRFGNSLMRED